MKKPSLIHVTAIIMIGVCLYSIINNLGALSYGAGLSRTYAKSAVSSFILILTIFSVCGIVAGLGLYFYKTWARWLTIGIAVIFLIKSFPGLLSVFSGWRLVSYNIQNIVYAMFAIWCLYYLNRSDVEEKFGKTKPSISSLDIIIADNKVTQPRGIKITSVLLIIICIIQILFLFLAVKKISSISGDSMHNVFWLFNTITILGAILPIMGVAAGIGLIRLKIWARKLALIFAIVSIVLYGFGALISLASRGSGFAFIFFLAFGCALPIWSLYYFTRPHIKILFAPQKSL